MFCWCLWLKCAPNVNNLESIALKWVERVSSVGVIGGVIGVELLSNVCAHTDIEYCIVWQLIQTRADWPLTKPATESESVLSGDLLPVRWLKSSLYCNAVSAGPIRCSSRRRRPNGFARSATANRDSNSSSPEDRPKSAGLLSNGSTANSSPLKTSSSSSMESSLMPKRSSTKNKTSTLRYWTWFWKPKKKMVCFQSYWFRYCLL